MVVVEVEVADELVMEAKVARMEMTVETLEHVPIGNS